MKPSIGRIVIVRDGARGYAPAIVNQVHTDECVSVAAFPFDGGQVAFRTSLTLGDHETLKTCEWCWPPRV